MLNIDQFYFKSEKKSTLEASPKLKTRILRDDISKHAYFHQRAPLYSCHLIYFLIT